MGDGDGGVVAEGASTAAGAQAASTSPSATAATTLKPRMINSRRPTTTALRSALAGDDAGLTVHAGGHGLVVL